MVLPLWSIKNRFMVSDSGGRQDGLCRLQFPSKVYTSGVSPHSFQSSFHLFDRVLIRTYCVLEWNEVKDVMKDIIRKLADTVIFIFMVSHAMVGH
ncbi:hypothetical protein AAC387_Pa05g1644 [Persea americana]